MILFEVHPSDLEPRQQTVIRLLAATLQIETGVLDLKSSFVNLGGTSIDAISLSTGCRTAGIFLSDATILASKTILELLDAPQLRECNAQGEKERRRHCSLDTSRRCFSHGSFQEATQLPRSKRRQYKNHFPQIQDDTCTSLQSSGGNKRQISEVFTDSHDPHRYESSFPENIQSLDSWTGPCVTEMQQLLVHGTQKDQTSNIISFAETYRLCDLPAVRAAWESVILREHDLQAQLAIDADGRIARYQSTPEVRWHEIQTDNETDYQREVDERPCTSLATMDLRAVILDRGWHADSVATVIWRIHHALIDGFSASLVYRKFQLALQGKSSSPGYPFSLVSAELVKLQDARANDSKAFWKHQRARYPGAVGKILLPRPLLSKHGCEQPVATVTVTSPMKQIKSICRRLGSTIASFYCAAWSLVLSRYAASYSVVFGLVYSGRSLPLLRAETAIGPLINTLPLCVDIDGSMATAALLQQVFNSMAELGEYQFARAEDGFDRRFSSTIAMGFDMSPADSNLVKPVKQSKLSITSDIPLSICIFETGNIQICYRTSSFRESDMLALATQFESTCSSLLDTERTVADILDNSLARQCHTKLLRAGNCCPNTTSKGHSSDTLMSLFTKAAAANPQRTALQKGPTSLTYSGLQLAIGRLSSALRNVVMPGDIVCVHADRSIWWIVAAYTCLNLGAVYAPVDPQLPRVARERCVQLTASKLFLVPFSKQKILKPQNCVNTISVEEVLSFDRDSPESTDPVSVPPSAGAYICFTSGSTSLPKAVLCTHEGLVAFQRDLEVRLFAAPGERIAQIMSPAFDGSIHEIFSALSYGATLVLPPSDTVPTEHLDSVTSALMTPTLLKALDVDNYPKLQRVYVVGEPVAQAVCDKYGNKVALYNMYGPTEATCGATIARLRPRRAVSIGRPNPSSRVYILDEQQRLLPPGVVGEIYIAGVQVSRGYLGLPEETKASFIEDTICPHTGENMYRTGDFGYWLSSGEIHFLGRQDRQIKLRGFRLDLNNLERRLTEALPQAKEVAIAVQDNQLVALLSPGTLDIEVVKEQAARVLQPQAMPRHFVAIDTFPKTAVGKRDYAAIAKSDFGTHTSQSPSLGSATEIKLAEIWRSILSLGPAAEIHPEDNFLALGGHSILQLTLARKVRSSFQACLDARAVLEISSRGTLRDLADSIAQDGSSLESVCNNMTISQSRTASELSPSELQWFERSLQDNVHTQCNVSLAWKIESEQVNLARLATSLTTAVERHSILTSRYKKDKNGHPRRVLSKASKANVTSTSNINITREVNRPFNLAHDSPIRIFVSPSNILLVAHHIVCDLPALEVVLRDAQTVYLGTELPAVTRAYQDMKWQITMSITPSWQEALSAAITSRRAWFSQPQDRPPRLSSCGTSIAIDLGFTALCAAESVFQQHQLTSHQVAVAAVTMALSHGGKTNPADRRLLLGGPNMNRKSEDAAVVGLFLEPLPIVTSKLDFSRSGEQDRECFLRSIQTASQTALANAAPWSVILDALAPEPCSPPSCSGNKEYQRASAAPSHQLFDAMVTFHNVDRSAQNMLGKIDGLLPLLTWAEGSKFKLMCEFTAVEETKSFQTKRRRTLLLRLEYSSAIYEEGEIWEIACGIANSLQKLAGMKAGDMGTGIQTLKARQISSGTAVEDLLF